MKVLKEARKLGLGLGFEGEDDDNVAIMWNMSFIGGYGWSKEREGWKGLRERVFESKLRMLTRLL